jgi:hypothetical protein
VLETGLGAYLKEVSNVTQFKKIDIGETEKCFAFIFMTPGST